MQGIVLFALAETELPKDNQERDAPLKRIYAWASQNTSESRQLTDFKYYWPQAATKLLATLELSHGSIIALVGLSGVGKSSAQSQIAKKLNEKQEGRGKAVHFKWPGYFDTNIDRILESLKEQGVTGESQKLIPQIIDRAAEKRDLKVLKSRARELLPKKWYEFDYRVQEDLKDYLAKNLGNCDAEILAEKLLGPTEEKIWKKQTRSIAPVTVPLHSPGPEGLWHEGHSRDEYRSNRDTEPLAGDQ